MKGCDYMKETKTEAISSAILCILSGLVLCIFNVSILTTITRVIGCIFLVIAILEKLCGKEHTDKVKASIYYDARH